MGCMRFCQTVVWIDIPHLGDAVKFLFLFCGMLGGAA
jgi:hypothetical protein